MLSGRRRDRGLRPRRPPDPDRRRAAAPPRHRRDHPLRRRARVSGWSSARTASRSPRTSPRILKREGVRGAVALARCARRGAPRRVPARDRRLAEHRRGREDPRPRRAAVHRADDGRPPQRRRARRDRRLRARRARRHASGTSTSSCRPAAARTCRTSRDAEYDRVLAELADIQRTVRRPHARQRQVRAALRPHPAPTGPDLAVSEELRRRCRRLSGGHALPGHPPERRRHAVPVPARFRRQPPHESLREIWQTPTLFVRIRDRTALGGRCGACELNAACGGCRARAYGMTGDVMAEDPLCTHTPGTFATGRRPPTLEYGRPPPRTRCRGTPSATRAHEADPGLRARHGQPPGRGLLPRAGSPRVTAESWPRSARRCPRRRSSGAAEARRIRASPDQGIR